MAHQNSSGRSRSGLARLALGVAISLGSLAVLAWNMDWDSLAAALSGADYWWLLGSLAALLAAVWLKVIRWQLLLAPIARVSQRNVLYSISIGYLVNTVLPGRLGELARVYILARLERLSVVAVLSTVAVDRILDIVVLALMLAAVLPTTDLPELVVQSGLLVGTGGVALLVVCLVLAYPAGQALFLRVLTMLPVFPGKAVAERWAGSMMAGMEGLRGIPAQLKVGATSAAIWIVSVFIFYFAQMAFHIDAPLWAAVLVATVTNLGMVIPSSPGYVGVFHYLVVLALGVYGVEKELALGYAVVLHVAELLPLSIMGVYSLWRCGLSLMGWRELAQPREGHAGAPGMGTNL